MQPSIGDLSPTCDGRNGCADYADAFLAGERKTKTAFPGGKRSGVRLQSVAA